MRYFNNFNHKGFSLIEIMIVVVIIGILSALAIPSYINYTNKAKVVESITKASKFKTAIAMLLEDGVNPQDINTNSNETINGEMLPPNFSISEGSIKITNAGGVTNANIIFELQDQGNDSYIWICQPGSGSNTMYLPSNCQSS